MSNMRNNFFFEEVIGTAEGHKKNQSNFPVFWRWFLNNLLCNTSVPYLSRCAVTDRHRMWKIKQVSKKRLDL